MSRRTIQNKPVRKPIDWDEVQAIAINELINDLLPKRKRVRAGQNFRGDGHDIDRLEAAEAKRARKAARNVVHVR